MRPQDAQRIGEQLSAYLDGELSDEERDAVEALLEGDAEARALLAELREASGAVRSLPRDRAPASILEQINARLERSELLGPADRKVTLARHNRRPIRSTLAMAASLIFVVTGGLWIYFRVADTQDGAPDKLAMRDRTPSPAPDKNMPALQDELRRLSGRMSDRGYAPAPTEEDAERLSSLGYMAEGTRSQPETTLVTRPIALDEFSPAQSAALDESVVDTVSSAETIVGEPFRGAAREIGKGVVDADQSFYQSATLELKLAAGDGLDAVATHRFDAEPLQLQLVVDSRYRGQLESTLETVLAGSGAVPLDSLGNAASTSAIEPTTVAFYKQGSPGDNYAPGAAPQRQILARVSPRAIERILQAAAAQDDAVEDVRFGVGRMSAEGVEESMRIARLVIPVDADAADDTMLGESDGYGGFGGGGRFGDAGIRAGRAGQEDLDGAAYAEKDSAGSKSEMTGPPSDPAELLAWLLDVPRVPAANTEESSVDPEAVAQSPVPESSVREPAERSRGLSYKAHDDDAAEKELSESVPARHARKVRAQDVPATTQRAEEFSDSPAAGAAVAAKSELKAASTQPADIDGDGTIDPQQWPLYTIVIQIIEKSAEPALPVPQSQPARE